MRHGDCQERDVLLARVMREDRAHKLLGDLGKAHSRRNRCIERYGASDRMQIGEANADRHGSTSQGFCPEPGTDPVRKMSQCGSENALFGELLADRRLCSCRSRPMMRPDFPRI